MSPVDSALERAISSMADLEAEMHRAGNTNGYNVHTMVTLLKGMRRPEVVEALDADRLQRARAA